MIFFFLFCDFLFCCWHCLLMPLSSLLHWFEFNIQWAIISCSVYYVWSIKNVCVSLWQWLITSTNELLCKMLRRRRWNVSKELRKGLVTELMNDFEKLLKWKISFASIWLWIVRNKRKERTIKIEAAQMQRRESKAEKRDWIRKVIDCW